MPLDGFSDPRCEQGTGHRRKQIDPKKMRLPRKSSRSKLASRIYAPSRGGTEQGNRDPNGSTHNPRDEWRKPGNSEAEPYEQNDDPILAVSAANSNRVDQPGPGCSAA
jgi:hypothetical protein